MPLHLKERFDAYIGLWEPLMYGISYFIGNIKNAHSDVLNRTFATWYITLGVHFAAFESENTPVPRLMSLANGTILELGPGSGNQLPRFDRTVVSKIYGIEPNEYLFNQLRDETIEKHGLTDIYVPIHGALEDQKLLDSFGVVSGSMDTIVCMQVLCSVSDVSEAVKQIHRLLKPGGQLLFWEHTVSRDMTTRWVQGLWTLLWKPLIGGCRLNRDIEKKLSTTVDWSIAEVGFNDNEPWSTMPRFWGRFIKR